MTSRQAESLAFRLVPNELEALAKKRGRRGAWLFGLGAFGLLFGTFWMFWGAIVLLTGVGVVNALIVFFFGGVGPTVGAVIVTWAGISRRRDAEELRQLGALQEGRPELTLDEVQAFLGRDERASATLLRLATEAGAAFPVRASGVRPALELPLDLAKLRAFRRSRFRRSLLLAASAVLVLGFATLWVVVGIAGIATGEWLVGLLLLIPGGAFPTLGAIALAWRALTNSRRSARAARVSAALLSPAVTSLAELARRTGLGIDSTRKTLLEAVELGIVPRDALGRLLEPLAAPAPSAPLPLEAWPGRTIEGRWQVESPLAQGGMGAVFRARDLALGRSVALKVLLPGALGSPEALARFELEAQRAGSIGHPGLVRVHAFGRTPDGNAFLVMDLLEGETLESLLARRGTLPWQRARRIAAEIGAALSAAHALGLLHRDIKPSNVFLARSDTGENAVLLDFGLVKPMDETAVSRMTQSGLVAGTPLYMSPEQARGESLDVRSDVYALAVVTYEMIAGVPPFFDKTVAEVYARLLREAAPRLSGVAPGACPEALSRVLERALSLAREERPENVTAFVQELEAVSDEPGALAG